MDALFALDVPLGGVASFLVFSLLFGWIIWRWSRKSEDPPVRLAIKVVVSLIFLAGGVWCLTRLHPLIGVGLGVALSLVVGILWGRNLGTWIVGP